jgi:hypothetical protein
MRQAITLTIIGLAAASGCDPAHAETGRQVDPKADELLRKMSTQLGHLKTFSFEADHVLEVVTKDGQKLQFVAQSRVSVQRPNKVRSDRLGPIADMTLYYDGNKISVFGKRTHFYATSPAPDNIDAAIDFARDELGLEAPAADLLYSNAYNGLMEDVISGKYIGNEPIADRMCHHLAYHGHKTDWQIWIQDGPQALPCRFVITTTDEIGQPEFEITMSNWNTAPKIAANEFEFTPPPDAIRIDFLRREEKAKSL